MAGPRRRRLDRIPWAAVLAAAAIGVGGCAGTQVARTPAPPPAPAPLSSSLVMPTAMMRGLEMRHGSADSWISMRNDHRLGYPAEPSTIVVDVAEVRDRDRQRVSNGRPRDYSTYTTRTLRILRR